MKATGCCARPPSLSAAPPPMNIRYDMKENYILTEAGPAGARMLLPRGLPDSERQLCLTMGLRSHESDIGPGEASDDFGETSFFHKCGCLLCIEPFSISRALLWPIVELSLHTKWENPYLAKYRFFGQPLLIMKVAKRPLTHDLTDQAGFFVCLSAGYLGRFSSFHWPALWDDPTVRLPRCQQHDLTGPVFANAPGEDPKLHGAIKLVFWHGL